MDLDQLRYVAGVQVTVRQHQQLQVEVKWTKRRVSQTKFTWRQLWARDDWTDWENSEFKQLNQYRAQDMFGEPVPRPRMGPCFISSEHIS